MNRIFCCFLLLFFCVAQSQELNCVVQINTDRVDNPNQQVFKTLQKSVAEFVNKTKWTELPFRQNERIECTIFINVSAYANDQFVASIQVQSSRPIFNSSYLSPVFNFNDKDFSFKYVEFENLFYNPNSFESNLVSVLAFYSYIMIGMDSDTFSPMGGTDQYSVAQQIVSTAQQSAYKGWSQADGNQNRFFLIRDLLSANFAPIREALYTYHLKGLDKMAEDSALGKEKIKEALLSLDPVYKSQSNAFITRVFFDAKADEIQSIFSGGAKMDLAVLIDQLNRFSPINASKWAAIRY